MQAGLALAQALEGGVSTIFVCLGGSSLLSRLRSYVALIADRLSCLISTNPEDPMILADRSPALFEEIRRNYREPPPLMPLFSLCTRL